MRRMLVVLLFLNVIPVLCAADEKAASGHYKAAEQVLTLMDTPNVLRQSIDQMVQIQAQQNPTIAPYEGVMKEFLSKYMSWDTLKVDLINLYMGEFSEAELNELSKFYQTPVGKKVVEKLPALMSKGAQMGAQRVQEHMPELQATIAAEEQKQKDAAAKKK